MQYFSGGELRSLSTAFCWSKKKAHRTKYPRLGSFTHNLDARTHAGSVWMMLTDFDIDAKMFDDLFLEFPQPSAPFQAVAGGSPSLSRQSSSGSTDESFADSCLKSPTPQADVDAAIEPTTQQNEVDATGAQGWVAPVNEKDEALVAKAPEISVVDHLRSSSTTGVRERVVVQLGLDAAAVEHLDLLDVEVPTGVTGGIHVEGDDVLPDAVELPVTVQQAVVPPGGRCIRRARGTKVLWKEERLAEMRLHCTGRGLDSCVELRDHLRYITDNKQQSQKEALTLFLHVARADGLLTAQTDDAVRGRWASFRVVAGNGDEFQGHLQELFGLRGQVARPNSKDQRTTDEAIRRLGYRPNGRRGTPGIWRQAYSGVLAFVAEQ
jgi:hypothetical protein